MKRKPIVIVGAVLLIVIGVVCIVYAAAELRKANQQLGPIQPPAKSLESDEGKEASLPKGVAARETRSKRLDKDAVWGLLRHWLLIALLLVVVMVVALLALRRFRPPRLHRRPPPSDMTDLWQEAGKRLK